MREMFETESLRERVILIGICTAREDDTEASLDELSELVRTAGADTVGRIIQNIITYFFHSDNRLTQEFMKIL